MARKMIVPFILGVLVFGLGPGLFPQDKDYEYRTPIKLNDGWEAASLSEVGIDPEKIAQITQEIKSNDQFDGIHSLLLVKNGKLVHEAYFWGHQRNSLHVLASITKSVASTF